MPSAITAPMYEGKPITAAEFIMRCARQFGGLAHMRDDRLDAPIVPRVANTEHYDKTIARLSEELDRYLTMTIEEAAIEVDKAHIERMASYEESCAKKNAIRARYEAILEQVKQWEPPTPEHTNLKDYAIKQIEDCIEWDCQIYDAPTKSSPEEWLEGSIEATKRSLEYYQRNKVEEIKRVEDNNLWVSQLVESIINFHHQGLPELKFESLEAPEED